MYLTKENLLTIEKHLVERGVKDLDFPVLTELTGEEYVVLSNEKGNNRAKLRSVLDVIESDIGEEKILGRVQVLEKAVGNTTQLIQNNTNLLQMIEDNTLLIKGQDNTLKILTEDLSDLKDRVNKVEKKVIVKVVTT